MADIVFTKEAFIAKLIHIATELDTRYDNHFPKNLGYWDGDKFSWDCWNLPKSIIWGWQENKTVGYYCYQPGLYGLDDLTGGGILALCDNVSSDFSDITPGEFLLTAAKDHAGIYVGEFTDRMGQTCNVVECTTSWSTGRVIGSWVDPNGVRRNCEGGTPSKAWARHGKMPWIDYNKPQPAPQPTPEPRCEEDGWWGPKFTLALQMFFGLFHQDGVVSRQPSSNKRYLPNASGAAWEFKGWPWYLGGSNLIKTIQQLIGASVDGYAGKEFVTKLQIFLKGLGFYAGLIDGSMGPGTVLAFQKWLNAQP